jgi:SAM-dependent methyltransferase
MPPVDIDARELGGSTLVRRWRKAVNIWRNAPSYTEAARELSRRVWLRTSKVAERREERKNFWQDNANVERFVVNSDPTTKSGAALMESVITEFFVAHCSKDDRVLDLGCGHGIVSTALAQHGCAVTACDVSEPMLESLAAKTESLNIQTRQADAYKLPFKNGEFDRVVARMFLYHFVDWPKVLREMARCCRPGGRLLIHITSKENVDAARRDSRSIFSMPDVPERLRFGRRSVDYGEFDDKSIRVAAKRSGLRLVERIPCMFFHNNPLVNFSIGAQPAESYREQFQEWLTKPDVLAFTKWFEEVAVSQMPPWFSYYNLLVLEKI